MTGWIAESADHDQTAQICRLIMVCTLRKGNANLSSKQKVEIHICSLIVIMVCI